MVRCFSDPEVVHVDGSVDPVRDLRVIHNELVRSAPLTYRLTFAGQTPARVWCSGVLVPYDALLARL